jgi:excisionase family DNA binding protein
MIDRQAMSEETSFEVVMEPIAVDTETAARLLGVSSSTVRAHVRRGELIPRYSGTKPIFPMDELRAFVNELPFKPAHL